MKIFSVSCLFVSLLLITCTKCSYTTLAFDDRLKFTMPVNMMRIFAHFLHYLNHLHSQDENLHVVLVNLKRNMKMRDYGQAASVSLNFLRSLGPKYEQELQIVNGLWSMYRYGVKCKILLDDNHTLQVASMDSALTAFMDVCQEYMLRSNEAYKRGLISSEDMPSVGAIGQSLPEFCTKLVSAYRERAIAYFHYGDTYAYSRVIFAQTASLLYQANSQVASIIHTPQHEIKILEPMKKAKSFHVSTAFYLIILPLNVPQIIKMHLYLILDDMVRFLLDGESLDRVCKLVENLFNANMEIQVRLYLQRALQYFARMHTLLSMTNRKLPTCYLNSKSIVDQCGEKERKRLIVLSKQNPDVADYALAPYLVLLNTLLLFRLTDPDCYM